MKANEIREMVISQLNNIKTKFGLDGVYWGLAQDDALFPHVLASFNGIRPLADDRNRRDIELIVDIYDRNNSAIAVNNIADAVEDLFDQANLPQTNSLPTFYFNDRRDVLDEDKMIKHIQLVFDVQNYERT